MKSKPLIKRSASIHEKTQIAAVGQSIMPKEALSGFKWVELNYRKEID